MRPSNTKKKETDLITVAEGAREAQEEGSNAVVINNADSMTMTTNKISMKKVMMNSNNKIIRTNAMKGSTFQEAKLKVLLLKVMKPNPTISNQLRK